MFAGARIVVIGVLCAGVVSSRGAGAAPSSKAPKAERRINLDVKDAELHNVLLFLADAGGVDLVVSDAVQGRVTVRLRDTPWRQALDVVLSSKGLAFERVGRVLEVDTAERLAERARKKAELARAEEETAPLVTRLFPLSYAKAAELKPLVAAMLSPRGRVEVDARTNVLIVTDVETRLRTINLETRGTSRSR